MDYLMLRKTKIICTLGPAIESKEMLSKMIEKGVDIFRFNMSHAQYDWCTEVNDRIRKASTKLNTEVGVIFDLQGPSIRTGTLEEDWQLKEGNQVEFRIGSAEPSIPYTTTVNYKNFTKDVKPNKPLVVDNGRILMNVDKVLEDRVFCTTLTPGKMTSRRHINLPGTSLSLPALSKKDLDDLQLAIDLNADFVAGSFVRNASDVKQIRDTIETLGGTAGVISKIENQEAIDNLSEIIKATDIIMIARGDLGIEIPSEELPIVQRRIVKLCHIIRRHCIVATHMLESMTETPTPTRAEVTDIANAVFEESDAIMLSGETSVGKYPLRCLETMDKISKRIEQAESHGFGQLCQTDTQKEKTIRSAVNLADSTENACIIVFTTTGKSARFTALERPKTSKIFAFSQNLQVVRQLKISRGITPFYIIFKSSLEEMLHNAIKVLKAENHLKTGDPVIVISDGVKKTFTTDSILFHRIQ